MKNPHFRTEFRCPHCGVRTELQVFSELKELDRLQTELFHAFQDLRRRIERLEKRSELQ